MHKERKMKKRRRRMRLLAVVLSFCLLVTACPYIPGAVTVHATVIQTGNCGANGSNVTYSLDDNGTLTISGSGAMTDFNTNNVSGWSGHTVKRVVIEYGVSAIGGYAFNGFIHLESVTIPESVISIGRYAFYECKALASVEIPQSVTQVEEGAFAGCTALKTVTIPGGITVFGTGIFGLCTALRDVTILPGVKKIASSMFEECTALEKVTIPDSVTIIEPRAFAHCEALASIEIPNSVTIIGQTAFSNCAALKAVKIPVGVTEIEVGTFVSCAALKSVEIPDSVTEIHRAAFRNCTALECIEIPDSVTSIVAAAYEGCSNAVIYYPDTAVLGEGWNNGTAATIKYTATDGEAEMCIEECSDALTALHLPATVSGYTPVSLNYEDYPDITVTHDGPHNFGEDGICLLCGEISEEKKVIDAAEVVAEALEEIEATNATTKEEIQAILDAALEEAGINTDDVTVTVEDFDKTEAEKYEDGEILGSVSIVSNQDADVRIDLEYDYIIDELVTNEEMVADAAAFVKMVLEAMEATNATTKEEIQEIINELLDEEEYIYDVVITVGELTKTEADQTAPGSITGEVTIVSENDETVTAGVPVNLTIAKLPAPVTGITIDKEEATLTTQGETLQLTASVVPAYADNKNVIWSSGNADVAAVDATGKVTAVGNGTCTVTVTSEDGSKTASCRITVNMPVITPTPTRKPPVKTPSSVKTPVPDKTPAPDKTTAPDKTAAPGKTKQPAATATPDVPKKIETPKKAPQSNAAFLYGGLRVRQSGKKIVISWNKAAGADGYDVYVQYCGKNFTAKSVKAIRSGTKTKTTVTKINGKALNLKKHFKVYVLAYQWVNGKKVKLGRTVAAHVVGSKAAGYTNTRTIRLGKSSYRLKKGERVTINANSVSTGKGKKQLSDAHTKEFRYASGNKKVATVSGKGKIKAVGTGSCTIYVYARNGYAKKLKVTVK